MQSFFFQLESEKEIFFESNNHIFSNSLLNFQIFRMNKFKKATFVFTKV